MKRYLFPQDYMADPSVHVFNGKIYIYPSHDYYSGIPEDDWGIHFDMKDYHVLSITGDPMTGEVKDEGVVLTREQIPWAKKQLWDCDVQEKDGKYYMYFPAKDKTGIFRCGVAISDKPEGPFIPEPHPIEGSYSIDYAIFKDDDGTYYMYFGGIFGGQLQRSGQARRPDPEGQHEPRQRDEQRQQRAEGLSFPPQEIRRAEQHIH